MHGPAHRGGGRARGRARGRAGRLPAKDGRRGLLDGLGWAGPGWAGLGWAGETAGCGLSTQVFFLVSEPRPTLCVFAAVSS